MPATYEPIASQTLVSNTATVTFSSIPATYTDLILVLSIRNTQANTYPLMRFNSDSSAVYSVSALTGTTTINFYRANNQTSMFINYSNALPSTASEFATFIVNIQSYSNTSRNKPILSKVANLGSATEIVAGLWRNTNAINTISLTCDAGTYATDSVFTLFGIQAA